jgi:Flp pilus assembly protein TadG
MNPTATIIDFPVPAVDDSRSMQDAIDDMNRLAMRAEQIKQEARERAIDASIGYGRRDPNE